MGPSVSLGATASSIRLELGRGFPDEHALVRLARGTKRSGQEFPDTGQGQADRMFLLGRRHCSLFQEGPPLAALDGEVLLEERLNFSKSVGTVAPRYVRLTLARPARASVCSSPGFALHAHTLRHGNEPQLVHADNRGDAAAGELEIVSKSRSM